MFKKQIYIVSDKNKLSFKIKNFLTRNLQTTNINKADIIIVLGGDGFMLQALKKFYKFNKPFYGINTGDYGFLMNKFSKENLVKNLSNADLVKISPIQMIVKNKKGKFKKSIAINEVSILRQSRQAVSISVNNGSRSIIKKLRGDGLLVSTPAGSTAYNLSVHGPILNLNSNKFSISPVSPFRPRRWKGKIVSNKSKITIKNLNPSKRPISAVADNFEVRNAVLIKISGNKKIIFNLLYNKNQSIEKKIKIEQLRNEVGK
jgi:NAD+ kinase|tara:strand:- start:51 stop:830 length:780 start_codon:yes stop_codon:yes gene_type:complete